MVEKTPKQFVIHQTGQYESSQLSASFFDAFRPLAESSSLKLINPVPNTPYAVVQSPIYAAAPPVDSTSSHNGSLGLLNLESLSSKILPLSKSGELIKNPDVAPDDNSVSPESVSQNNVSPREDALYSLEQSMGNLSTDALGTGALAMSGGKSGNSTLSDISISNDSFDASKVPSSPFNDDGSKEIASNGEEVGFDENRENVNPIGRGEELYACWFSKLHLRYHPYYGPLSTIFEWQSRESCSSTTAYYGKTSSRDKTGEVVKGEVEELSENPSISVFVSKTRSCSRNLSPGPRRSGVLQSSQMANSLHSLKKPKQIPSETAQVNNSASRFESRIFDQVDEGTSCRLPAHLLSPVVTSKRTQRCPSDPQMTFPVAAKSIDDADPRALSQKPSSMLFKSHEANALTGCVDLVVPRLDLTCTSSGTATTINTKTSEIAMATLPSVNCDVIADPSVYSLSSRTCTVATQSVADNEAVAKGTKTSVEVDLSSNIEISAVTKSQEIVSNTVDVCDPMEVKPSIKRPIKVTSRCLFWRSCTFGLESKQQFILRQETDHLMRVKLHVVEGDDVFTLLDHRGQRIRGGFRVIELPPRLSCTVTVVYRPRPPNFWHTGVLAFREVPGKNEIDHEAVLSRCYLQRLIGYVGGSSVYCVLCRGVDERTYWTSAFSAPADLDASLQISSPSYYARISIGNLGSRAAWIYGVAVPLDSDVDTSRSPLSGVRLKPSRFVLRPNQSKDVVITISERPQAVQVLFYNGDEVIRHQIRKILKSSGQPERPSPRKLPKPHRRLNSAYIMRSFEEEIDDIELAELPVVVCNAKYDWHGALVDEQSSRAPLSLTVYPQRTETAAKTSLEASTSLIVIGNHHSENVKKVLQSPVGPLISRRLSNSFENAGHLSWTGEDSVSRGRFASLSTGNVVLPSEQAQPSTATPANVDQSSSPLHDEGNWTHGLSLLSLDGSRLPQVSLVPDTQLCFKSCRPGLFRSAVLQLCIKAPSEASLDGSGGTTSTSNSATTTTSSARRRMTNLWRLFWHAEPLPGDCEEGVFSLLKPLSLQSMVVEVGKSYHLAFCFNPPAASRGADVRFVQRWVFYFFLSRSLRASLELRSEDLVKHATQIAELEFVGFVDNNTPDPPIFTSKPKTGEPLLKIRGVPLVFTRNTPQCSFELLNTSHDERLVVVLGNIEPSLFALVKSESPHFTVGPRSSVRIGVRCYHEEAERSKKSTCGTLHLWWYAATNPEVRHEKDVPLLLRA